MARSTKPATVVLPDQEPLISRERIMRVALWSSVALNMLGVVVFLPPALGIESFMVPLPAPRLYMGQIAYTIAFFGCVYAWLAMQERINRALVVVGALGKLGFFLLFAGYWMAGDVPATFVMQASPDFVLAVVFLWWAGGEQPLPGSTRG
ncbi:MAG: hypothetical protein ABIW79_01315 [Gemmatimonas sp.]